MTYIERNVVQSMNAKNGQSTSEQPKCLKENRKTKESYAYKMKEISATHHDERETGEFNTHRKYWGDGEKGETDSEQPS